MKKLIIGITIFLTIANTSANTSHIREHWRKYSLILGAATIVTATYWYKRRKDNFLAKEHEKKILMDAFFDYDLMFWKKKVIDDEEQLNGTVLDERAFVEISNVDLHTLANKKHFVFEKQFIFLIGK